MTYQYSGIGESTLIDYWILGEGCWILSSPREIQELISSGFTPVIRIEGVK